MAKCDFRRVHRKYVDMYLQSQNEEIERAAFLMLKRHLTRLLKRHNREVYEKHL